MSRIKCPHCHLPIWAGAVACKGCGLQFRAAPPPAAPPVFYPPPPAHFQHYQPQPPPIVHYPQPQLPQPPTYPAYTPSDMPAAPPSPYQNRPPLNIQVIPKTKALLDSRFSDGDGLNVVRWCVSIIVGTIIIIRIILALQ